MATMSLAPPAPPSGPSPSPPTTTTGGGNLPVPVRPKFNSHITSDRLREGAGLRLPPFASNIQKGRTSVFREMGLDGDAAAFGDDTYLVVRDNSDDIASSTGNRGGGSPQTASRPWYAKLAAARPALAKRRSSQGRIAIPSVHVVGPDAQ